MRRRSRALRGLAAAAEALVLTSWFTARSGLPAAVPAVLVPPEPRTALALLEQALSTQPSMLPNGLEELTHAHTPIELGLGEANAQVAPDEQADELAAIMSEGVADAALRLEELEELASVLSRIPEAAPASTDAAPHSRACRQTLLPQRIECFDVSHLYGSYTVAASSFATCGVLDLKRYGCYPIGPDAGVTPGDDCAALRVALRLRFGGYCCREAISSQQSLPSGGGAELPDLLIIDGGKAQLGAAMDVLQEV
eukprot:scaffold298900_cov33-Tisochrysis_lutea.AAC.5